MAHKGGQQLFSNSVNTSVSGGTWTVAQGDVNFYSPEISSRHGLKLLLAAMAQGAVHDAAERGDPPRCHAHTRKAILSEIMQWIKSQDAARRTFILWLYGPAGAGKSAIAQTIAELCAQEGLLAASFFFARTAAGRNTSARFVANLAYQLSRYVPEIREAVLAAIEDEPTIFSRAISTQARVLLAEPLKAAAAARTGTQPLLRHPAFVVVDGVDECGDGPAQKELLGVLGALTKELQHIPLIFLVASRPEYEIREAFNEDPLRALMHGLVLDDNYKPDEDIRRYFVSTFQGIQRKQSDAALGSFPAPWPTESDLSQLVEKASGQFIFAATVTKFVDSPRFSPVKRLDIVLGLAGSGKDAAPFASLDALYRFILGSVADVDEVLKILTLLMYSNNTSIYLQVDVVEELLGFEIRRALVDMHALILVPPPNSGSKSVLRIHHASMYDFLMDPSRSQEYAIDSQRGHIELTVHWIKLMGRFPTSKFARDHPLVVCVNAFVRHCLESPSPNSEIADELARLDLASLLGKLDQNDIYTTPWNDLFFCAKQQGGDREDVFPRLQKQFDDFIRRRLSQYPSAFQSSIPAMFTMDGAEEHLRDIFHVLLHAGRPSVAELRQIQKTDYQSLNIQSALNFGNITALATLFKDKSRAGQFYAGRESYVRLSMLLVKVLLPRYQSNGRPQPTFCKVREDGRFLHNGEDPTARVALTSVEFPYFKQLIDFTSTDARLAMFLRDRALQYIEDAVISDGQKSIATASLRYVQNAGIPYRRHDHPPHTDICVICSKYGDAPADDELPYIANHSPLPAVDVTNSARTLPSPIAQPGPVENRAKYKFKKSKWRRLYAFVSRALFI